MLEVLITIVVLSLGLLGFAGLQAYSMKTNRVALERSLATMYAYSIIDCMRANRVQALAGSYTLAAFASAQATDHSTVAKDDVHDWLDAVHGNLPNGMGMITVNGTMATIQIRWTENLSASAADQRTLTFETDTSL